MDVPDLSTNARMVKSGHICLGKTSMKYFESLYRESVWIKSSSPDEILTLSYTLFIEVKNESLGRDSLPRDSFLLQWKEYMRVSEFHRDWSYTTYMSTWVYIERRLEFKLLIKTKIMQWSKTIGFDLYNLFINVWLLQL